MSRISSLRKILWHFRRGGLKQVRLWRERENYQAGNRTLENVKGAEGVWVGRGKKRQLQFKPARLGVGASLGGGPRPRVGVVLDEFSAAGFAYEWDCVPLTPANWLESLSSQAVDFVFVESVWSGTDGCWAGKVARTDSPDALSKLVEWCRQRNIPTIFWNKEDPPHYSDFLVSAKLFDFVFTSDAGKLSDYRKDLGHCNVDVLSFAAQPAIHNPVRPGTGWHKRDVAFAGMYFAEKYPERVAQLDLLLGAARSVAPAMGTGLEIFTRVSAQDPRYMFPEEFAPSVVGSLDYPQMVTAYKAYKIFLNVNSVVDSESMCSRRIFEIAAAGSSVLSTPTPALANHFAEDELFTVSTEAEARDLLLALYRNPEIADRQLHRAQRRIWREHTYSARSDQIVAAAVPSWNLRRARPLVSAVVSTIRPKQLEHVFEAIGRQLNIGVELVLVTHGFEVHADEVSRLQRKFCVEHVTLLSADRATTLGDSLNLGVAAAAGNVIAKMDDDDFYGPYYLSDQVYALQYSRSDIVGKQAHYMHLAARNATLLRFPQWEHRYTRTVMGPTLMGSSDVFHSIPFRSVASGEDTAFLQDVTSNGGAVYAADRFNYCQQRAGKGHTWQVTDDALLATGELKFFGNYRDEVSV